MSEDTSNVDSTESENEAEAEAEAETTEGVTVGVFPGGMAANPRYISDESAYGELVMEELQNLANITGDHITKVVFRGSYQIAEMLDDELPIPVDSYSLDFRRFLDDVEATEEGEHGSDTVTAVREEDEPPMSQVVDDIEGLSVTEMEEFDINDRESRAFIGYEVLNEIEQEGERDRIDRARNKAKAVANERVLNGWYDGVPTVDHALVLSEGNAYENIIPDLRGSNSWVIFPDGLDDEGEMRLADIGSGLDDPLDATFKMLEASGGLEPEELSEAQIEDLRDNHDAETLEDLGVSVDEDAGGDGAAPSVSPAGVAPAVEDANVRPDGEAEAVAGRSD